MRHWCTGPSTRLFGSGEKVLISVKLEGMGFKILEPWQAPIEPLQGGGP